MLRGRYARLERYVPGFRPDLRGRAGVQVGTVPYMKHPLVGSLGIRLCNTNGYCNVNGRL